MALASLAKVEVGAMALVQMDVEAEVALVQVQMEKVEAGVKARVAQAKVAAVELVVDALALAVQEARRNQLSYLPAQIHLRGEVGVLSENKGRASQTN